MVQQISGDAIPRKIYSEISIWTISFANLVLVEEGGGHFQSGMRGSAGASPFASVFGQTAGGGGCGGGCQQPVKGQDRTYQLSVTLEDVLKGSEKSIALKSNGSQQNVSVRIPKGIESGKKLRLKGKGGEAPPGGIPGDLFLKINIAPHSNYTREGANLFLEKRIPYSLACLGAKVDVETLDGKKFKVNIPAGIQADAKLRLKGHGLPGRSNSDRGDLYVKVGVDIPKELSDEQLETIEKLQEVGL